MTARNIVIAVVVAVVVIVVIVFILSSRTRTRTPSLRGGLAARRRAVRLALGGIVRWSDGSAGEALRWWDAEILFCEGDIVGKLRPNCAACTSDGTATTFARGPQ